MIKHQDSHVDHGLTEAQLNYLLDRFVDRSAFFLETVELPEDLGTVPCGLWGPIMGDPPISEDDVRHAARGPRAWTSRLIERPARPTRLVTVIAGPHAEPCPQCTTSAWNILHRADCPTCGGTGELKHTCILYTAFGGPASPQEPGDPGCKDVDASAAFWRDHALAK
jgi:hypothetical protein